MEYKTTAGVGLGEPTNAVVLIDENGVTTNLVIKNRWLYVKKCLRPEDIGGILLCDATRSDTVVSLVLAVSDDCGKFHKLTKEQKRRGEASSVNMTVKPHDKIITPDTHEWGIRRSPYGRDEYFIREDIIKAKVEDE